LNRGPVTGNLVATKAKSLTPRQGVILDCTIDLVREGGPGALTTKKIAEKMGFTEPALYRRHFPTKKALVIGLMRRLEDVLLAPIQCIASDDAHSLEQRLKRILVHHIRLAIRHRLLPVIPQPISDPCLPLRWRSRQGNRSHFQEISFVTACRRGGNGCSRKNHEGHWVPVSLSLAVCWKRPSVS